MSARSPAKRVTKSPSKSSKSNKSFKISPSDINEETIVDNARTFDQYKFFELLRMLDDHYHNDESLIEDETYDELVDVYTSMYGPYTPIGAEPRGDKVDLPYYLSSLNKLKEKQEINRWIKSHSGPYLLMDKIDGLTLLLVSKKVRGKLTTFLYTRGGGVRGKDVSHLIHHIHLPPVTNIAVRGEIVMHGSDFNEIQSERGFEGKSLFKNPRNLVSGIVNAQKSFDAALAAHMTFYAYRIMDSDASPSEQMDTLRELGFNVPHPTPVEHITKESLTQYLLSRKVKAPYEMDGLVVYEDIKEIDYPADANPKDVIAFKMKTPTARTTVIQVTWQGSKDLRLIPVVHIQPRFLSGAEISRVTGINAKFIQDNSIGPDAVIKITRSGDTIPKILRVITPAPDGPSLPDVQSEWDENGVHLLLLGETDEVRVSKIKHFITTIDLKNFGPARIAAAVKVGLTSVSDLIQASPKDFTKIPGLGPKLSAQIYADLHNKIRGIGLSKLLDASGFFPGVGERRFDDIVAVHPNLLMLAATEPIGPLIQKIRGFNKIAMEIEARMPAFLEWLDSNPQIEVATFKAPSVAAPSTSAATLMGKTIVFSGFRDGELEEQIKTAGGKVSTSVSRNTSFIVMKDVTDIKGKASAALEKGIPLISREDFIRQYLQ